MLQYAVVAALSASLAAAAFAAGIGERVGEGIESALCVLGGEASCDGAAAETAAGEEEEEEGGIPPPLDDEDDEPEEEDDPLSCSGTWPDLVGLDGEEAKRRLEAEEPDLTVSIVRTGQPVTMDFRCGRVRIVVDHEGTVVSAPGVG